MPTCSFCKKHYKEPRGLSVFTFDGKTIHFCSSKCRRNRDLKRDPRKVNWIKREKKMTKAQKQAEIKAELEEEKAEEEAEEIEKKAEVKKSKEEKKTEEKEEKKE
jgi:large subunit ribosomal protein L24e